MTTATTTTPQAAATAPTGPGRVAVRGLGVLLAVLLVGWGAVQVVTLLARATDHRTATFDQVSAVDLALGFESVTVVGGDSSTVSLDRSWSWSLQEPTVSEEVIGGRLLVRSVCHWNIGWGCTGHVRLTVPRGTPLTLRSGDGSMSVRGIDAAVDISTGDGKISARDIGGPLTTRSGDGSVDIRGLRAPTASVQTGDGSISIEFAVAPNSVAVRSGDGTLTVLVPRGTETYQLQLSTGDGRRDVSVPTDPSSARVLRLATGDGTLRVAYAP